MSRQYPAPPRPRLLAHPRADAFDQTARPPLAPSLPARFFFPLAALLFCRAAEAQLPHTRPAHQLRHAVDDDDGAVFGLEASEQRHESRGVLAVGDVDDEDDFRLAEVALHLRPLALRERRAEVVRGDAKAGALASVDLPLRVAQGGEQARTDVENRGLHLRFRRRPRSGLPGR